MAANYRLLEAFEGLFKGHRYLHRRSNLGDLVAMEFYEDLFTLGRSKRLIERIESGMAVLSTQNMRIGVKARRGDGSFGEIVPNTTPIRDEGYAVCRGPIATIEIGIEVKVLFKAMIKQIDRVINDLRKQVDHFKSKGGKPITVGIAGINFAERCTTYEGTRKFRTDGKKYKHPLQEAKDAESRLLALAAPAFDEFLVLQFQATNEPPYDFKWFGGDTIVMNYGAILARVSQRYERAF